MRSHDTGGDTMIHPLKWLHTMLQRHTREVQPAPTSIATPLGQVGYCRRGTKTYREVNTLASLAVGMERARRRETYVPKVDAHE